MTKAELIKLLEPYDDDIDIEISTQLDCGVAKSVWFDSSDNTIVIEA